MPTDPLRNAAALAVQGVLDRLDAGAGPGSCVAVEVRKGIPLASGLGGSAASAVAGRGWRPTRCWAAGWTRAALLECALIGERKGSGANHADNAAPSLIGGFVLVLPGLPTRTIRLPTPPDMTVAVAHPALEVETRRARTILGDTIPLAAGIRQWGNAAGMAAGLYEADWELIARCLRDAVAEPVRARLVPGFERVRDAALGGGGGGGGAVGVGAVGVRAVPGAGGRPGGSAAAAMAAAFSRPRRGGVRARWCRPPRPSGARILETG